MIYLFQFLRVATCLALLTVKEIEVPSIPYDDYKPIFSFLLALELNEQPNPNPNPIPDPNPIVKVGDKCPKCEGRGKVDYDHDGRMDADCTDCRGDGRVDEGDPILNKTSAFLEERKYILFDGMRFDWDKDLNAFISPSGKKIVMRSKTNQEELDFIEVNKREGTGLAKYRIKVLRD